MVWGARRLKGKTENRSNFAELVVVYKDDCHHILPFLYAKSTAPLKDEVYFFISQISAGFMTTSTNSMWQKHCSATFESDLEKIGRFCFFPLGMLLFGTKLLLSKIKQSHRETIERRTESPVSTQQAYTNFQP